MPSSGVKTCALDRKSTRLNSSHGSISYAVFCFKKKNPKRHRPAADLPAASDFRRRRLLGARGGLTRGPDAGGDHETPRTHAFFFMGPAGTENLFFSLPDALPT